MDGFNGDKYDPSFTVKNKILIEIYEFSKGKHDDKNKLFLEKLLNRKVKGKIINIQELFQIFSYISIDKLLLGKNYHYLDL